MKNTAFFRILVRPSTKITIPSRTHSSFREIKWRLHGSDCCTSQYAPFSMARNRLASFLGNCWCDCRTRVCHLQLTRGHGEDAAARSGYCRGRSDRPKDRPVRELRHFWRSAVRCDNLFGIVLLPVRIALAVHIRKTTSLKKCTFLGVGRLPCRLCCLVWLSDTVTRTFLELSIVIGEQVRL